MDDAESRQKTALVLCGGGSRGAAEVGLYQALRELGVGLDLVVGTSVGAVNGAFIAAGASVGDLRRLWGEFPKRRPFRLNWEILWKGRAAPGLLDRSGFRRFLEDTLPVKTFEALRVPLTIVATDLQKGESILQRHRWDMERLKDKIEIVVLEPCLTSARNILDFRYSERVIEEGYRFARSVLATARPARTPRNGAGSRE